MDKSRSWEPDSGNLIQASPLNVLFGSSGSYGLTTDLAKRAVSFVISYPKIPITANPAAISSVFSFFFFFS
jgi:hypothetical protein